MKSEKLLREKQKIAGRERFSKEAESIDLEMFRDTENEDEFDYSAIPREHLSLVSAKNAGLLTAYDLKSPQVVDSAYKALLKLLRGESFGDIETVDARHVMAAVKMVYDRVDPAVKRNLNVSIHDNSFIDRVDKIELSKAKNIS